MPFWSSNRSPLNLSIVFRKKIEEIGKMAGLTQDEILQSTRTVCQGLEALKEEHETIKSTLLGSVESLQTDEKKVVEDKSKLLSKNLDAIQLGIEEAHVSWLLKTINLYLFHFVGNDVFGGSSSTNGSRKAKIEVASEAIVPRKCMVAWRAQLRSTAGRLN
jgi:hypothetical protein